MSTNEYEWRDATGYSQSEQHPRTPRTWEWGPRPTCVIVTRLHGIEHKWFVRCDAAKLSAHELFTDDIDDAKPRALKLVADRLTAVAEELRAVAKRARKASA